MKVLYGYLKDKRPAFTRISHDIEWFGEGEDDIIIQAKGATFQEIIARLPSGWLPDMVLFSDPAYYLIPTGIEDSPFPTAAIIGDWNLSFNALRKSADLFDYLFTDLKGVEIFKRHNYGNVEYFPMFSFDPEVHRPLPEIEKVYDICFIGNLNHAVQRERAQWLRRIAMLSQKYKVTIANGIYGEDYTRLLNQSKIIFNRSIRGEMNMRAYEAPACRTLLFFEEENLEVRNFYTDRVHCVLYNEDNLEELMDYYLQNETEREEIAKRGHERVQELTHENRMIGLLDRIERNIGDFTKKERVNRGGDSSERHNTRAVQAFWSITPKSMEVAAGELKKGLQLSPENPELWNNMGVVLATCSKLSEGLSCFQKAVERDADYALGQFNSGYCYYRMGQWGEAETSLLNAVSLLEKNPDELSSIAGLYLPALYDTFKVEDERITFSSDSARQPNREKTKLFLWRVLDLLGDVYLKKGSLAPAREAFRRAIEKRPDMGETRYKLGQVVEQCGEFEEALYHYEEAIRATPFLFSCWESEVHLLNLTGRWKEAGEKSLAYRTMLQAIPHCKDLLQSFTSLAVQSLLRHAIELITQRSYEETMTLLGTLVKIDSANPKIYALSGECAFLLKRYQDAEVYLLQALDLSPKNDDILISLGVVCHEQGREQEATSYFKEAEAINPENPDLLANFMAMEKVHNSL